MSKRKQVLILLVFLSAFTVGQSRAQQADKTVAPSKDQERLLLPLNPEVKTGKLPNGFSYYIQKNAAPAQRVQLYLVVKAGSILETEQQRGMAHYIEHMSFNGTTHYPKNELINYLQKGGVRFGSDINAYTSFDETVYKLPLPTADVEMLNNGFQIMRDWAQNALLEQGEIDQERGVILEEKRMKKGVQERVREKTLPVLLNRSRYADRQPIGTEEAINSFNREDLAAFYKNWYRPDLQALIVVGDIDVNDVEKRIHDLFSDLKNPKREKKRIIYDIPLSGKNQFVSITDKEQAYTVLQLYSKHKAAGFKTTDDLLTQIARSLFNRMLSARMSELMNQPTPPFMQCKSGISSLFSGLDAFTTMIVARPGETEVAFKAAYGELVRLKKFGFTAGELNRARDSYLASVENEYNERDKIPSDSYADEYVNHFTEGTASPGIAYTYQFVKKNIDRISLDDLMMLADQYRMSADCDVIITAPEKEGPTLPDDQKLTQWMGEVEKSDPTPYEDQVTVNTLLEALPVGGKIIATEKDEAIGITKLTLSNGITVILKPTTFKNDQILINGVSPGGTSLYNNEDYLSAVLSAALENNSGVSSFDGVQLSKMLSGRTLMVKPYIEERFEGIAAGAIEKDLETAFQLIYLYFTAPRKDPVIFQSVMKQQKATLSNRSNDPASVFADTVNALLGNYHYRSKAPSPERLGTIDLDRAYTIYKERFADASDFTFVIIGSFKEESLKPLLEQYLGALPALHKKEQARDLGIRVPAGKITKRVYKGTEDKAVVRLVFSGDHVYNQYNNLLLDGLKEVLLLRLTERLRENEGGVYSPGVNAVYTKNPVGTYTITVSFSCAPANVEKLVAAALDEIQKLKKSGPPAVDVDKYLVARQRGWEVMQHDNEFWYSFLVNVYKENESAHKVLTYLDELNKITSAGIRQAAGTYFNLQNMIRFELLPELSN